MDPQSKSFRRALGCRREVILRVISKVNTWTVNISETVMALGKQIMCGESKGGQDCQLKSLSQDQGLGSAWYTEGPNA